MEKYKIGRKILQSKREQFKQTNEIFTMRIQSNSVYGPKEMFLSLVYSSSRKIYFVSRYEAINNA